eukprot:TRINITY_DN5106_c0_g1_i1.p1 TRINITY_DN5106_c0_g1~~TRINITY_DN5106_c0_g1_i1.p1  ORF type:complete len:119 (+),score=7.36 TRINITY_DN5106_c0_g1_i1:897-1253(+)
MGHLRENGPFSLKSTQMIAPFYSDTLKRVAWIHSVLFYFTLKLGVTSESFLLYLEYLSKYLTYSLLAPCRTGLCEVVNVLIFIFYYIFLVNSRFVSVSVFVRFMMVSKFYWSPHYSLH